MKWTGGSALAQALGVGLLLGSLGLMGLFSPEQNAPEDGAGAAISKSETHREGGIKFLRGELEFKPCSLSAGYTSKSSEARCATFSVPEDRNSPSGRSIELYIAWLPAAEMGDAKQDPLFLISGGPGQSAVESFGIMKGVFKRVLEHRDIFLVDQRGTGKSNPLKCPEFEKLAEQMQDSWHELNSSQRNKERKLFNEKAVKECKEKLEAKADLRFYSTTDAVYDLDAVRRAIGAKQINLYGVSYGTRVVQQYAKRFPEHTRSITLDSVVPNAVFMGNIWAKNLDQALEEQFALCKNSPDCQTRLGNSRQKLAELKKTLEAKPPEITYRDPRSGEQKTGRLYYEEVAGLVRMYAYLPYMSALLPLQIHEASEGRYSTLKALVEILMNSMGDMMAMGMQFSVICSEDAESIKVSPEDEGTVLGHALTESLSEACRIWPRGEAPSDFHQPLRGDVPALVIQGELDPVTPPAFGEQVAKELSNVNLLTLRGQGHGVIAEGCMPKVFAEFIQSADPQSLKVECLSKLDYTPPFVSFNGWGP